MLKTILGLAFGLALAAMSPNLAFAASTEIRVGLVLEPPSLDPTSAAAAAIKEVTYQNIFEGLTRIDQNGAVQPLLAHSWTISDDGLTYTFKLEGGVRFHDGSDFDAEDVVYTFNRIIAPDSTNSQKALYEPIASVTAVDPHTVKIVLKHPDGQFLFDIGRGDAVIVSPEGEPNNATAPIGTGPFAFVQWDKGSRIVLERNEDYWGTHPALTKITFVFISDPNTAISAVLAGDIDGFPNFPAPEALDVIKADPRFKVTVGTTEGETLLATNNAKPPFNNLKVRQAMAHAIDRKAIIDGAQSGYGTPIGSHFAPHNPYYVDLTNTYPYDPAAAKKLLAEAGFPNGFSTTIKLPPPTYARRGGQIIAAQLAAIGIKAQLINVEWAQWLTDVYTNKDFDLTIISHVEPFDIGIYANPNYYFGYNDPQFQAIMAKLNNTTKDEDRKALAIEAMKRLAEQAVNGYLFELAQVGVWNVKVEGQWLNAPIEGAVLTGVHWAD
ncbi:MAG TPA: ABC transporter substrate-binding protein [Arsenicitalea sp.]|nr:ABC transporter substrate-binding protein [Arsenicitalea sp.]